MSAIDPELPPAMGRRSAPTYAEIEAHQRLGGTWLWQSPTGEIVATAVGDLWVASNATAVRWWPINAEGDLTAWPVTP